MNSKIFVLFLFIIFSSCIRKPNCINPPTEFRNYNDAVKIVRNTNFKVEQSFKNKEWISKGEYYSCDGDTGYLILRMTEENYIFDDVPISVWSGLKQAKSKGRFYNEEIKGRYSLDIN